MATTTPDGISYPTNADSQKTLEQRIQDTATSVQTALTHNTVAVVASATARDARFPSPVQGDGVWRSDKGWEERYFSLYNSSTNQGGASVAGWYPVAGNLPSALVWKTAAQTTGSADVLFQLTWDNPRFYNYGMYSSSSTAIITAPVTGLYRVNVRTTISTTTAGVWLRTFIYKNGSALDSSRYWMDFPTNGTAFPWNNVDETVVLSANDQISIYITSNAGSMSIPADRCFFEMQYLGPPRGNG